MKYVVTALSSLLFFAAGVGSTFLLDTDTPQPTSEANETDIEEIKLRLQQLKTIGKPEQSMSPEVPIVDLTGGESVVQKTAIPEPKKKTVSKPKRTQPLVKVLNCTDKVIKTEKRYGKNVITHGWRVSLMNTTNRPLSVYVQVEWLDYDSFQIKWTNDVRTIKPGRDSISGVREFDNQDHARIQKIRVSKISVRQ